MTYAIFILDMWLQEPHDGHITIFSTKSRASSIMIFSSDAFTALVKYDICHDKGLEFFTVEPFFYFEFKFGMEIA